MNHTWTVNVWGVRGAFPAPGAAFLEYGGNTSCISVDYGSGIVIFDGGSGLPELGRCLKDRKVREVHILISHLHIDHCLGLFPFPLFQDPHARIHLYGGPHENMSFRKGLEALLGSPYWPLGLKDFPAHVDIHELLPGAGFDLAGTEGSSHPITIRTLAGNHPGQSMLYRMSQNDKSVIYALDCELDKPMEHSLAEFAQGGGLLIWDANFTEAELEAHRGWGHSTWKEGAAVRRMAGVRSALMTHYASGHTDSFLRAQELCCREYDPASIFAREGLEIRI